MDRPGISFDNLILRRRGSRCLIATVTEPLRTAFWPNVDEIAGLPGATLNARGFDGPEERVRLLAKISERADLNRIFAPAPRGAADFSGSWRRREVFRRHYRQLTFLDAPTREMMFGALEMLTAGLDRSACVDVQFKEWDALADWPSAEDRVQDAADYLYGTRQFRGNITLFSELKAEVSERIWQTVYQRPWIRLAWVAWDLAIEGAEQILTGRQQRVALRDLQKLSELGIWPHVILPVAAANVQTVPELASMIIEISRGGTVEIAPVHFLPDPLIRNRDLASGTDADALGPPAISDYVAALLAVYRNARIPLRWLMPHRWVISRVDSPSLMVNSPTNVGAELAVLSNGDVYASQWAVGIERWRLGNIIKDGGNLKWEILDFIAELFGNSLESEPCRTCDWRYRCGGIDASIAFEQERQQRTSLGASLFDYYCAPRKALFEEMLWDSTEAAAARAKLDNAREKIELRLNGIDFVPANRSADLVER